MGTDHTGTIRLTERKEGLREIRLTHSKNNVQLKLRDRKVDTRVQTPLVGI